MFVHKIKNSDENYWSGLLIANGNFFQMSISGKKSQTFPFLLLSFEMFVARINWSQPKATSWVRGIWETQSSWQDRDLCLNCRTTLSGEVCLSVWFSGLMSINCPLMLLHFFPHLLTGFGMAFKHLVGHRHTHTHIQKLVYWCVSLRSVGRDMPVSMVTTRLFH